MKRATNTDTCGRLDHRDSVAHLHCPGRASEGREFENSDQPTPPYAQGDEMQNLSEDIQKKRMARLTKKGSARRRELVETGDLTVEQNLMKKAAAAPNSKAKAIAAFCFNCMGGTLEAMPDPGWKEQIRTCTVPGCPLYPHRPYRPREVQR